MKRQILPLLLMFLLLTSCSSSNRIYHSQDDFKDQKTIKLNQTLKGYSDENRKGLANWADYYVTLKHYYASEAKGEKVYKLDVKLSTPVRAHEVDPVLYISIDGERVTLDAEETVTKMYQQGGSSTSSETTTSESKDPENKGEKKVETSTTYTTSSSHDTYQLMQLTFSPDLELLKEISNSKKTLFRLYIKNEAIDVPLKWKYHRKFEKYVNQLVP